MLLLNKMCVRLCRSGSRERKQSWISEFVPGYIYWCFVSEHVLTIYFCVTSDSI